MIPTVSRVRAHTPLTPLTHYSEFGWKNTKFKIKAMPLAYLVKADYMGSARHS